MKQILMFAGIISGGIIISSLLQIIFTPQVITQPNQLDHLRSNTFMYLYPTFIFFLFNYYRVIKLQTHKFGDIKNLLKENIFVVFFSALITAIGIGIIIGFLASMNTSLALFGLYVGIFIAVTGFFVWGLWLLIDMLFGLAFFKVLLWVKRNAGI